MASITVKRGDTIRWAAAWTAAGVAVNLTGYDVRCELRRLAGTLVETLTVTLADQGVAPGEFTIEMEDTSSLANGIYAVDLRIEQPDGDSYASETWDLEIVDPVTRRW